MRFLFFIIILINALTSQCQTLGGEAINPNYLTSWNVRDISEYEGVYFFGFSEGESQLNLAIDGSIVCAQIEYAEWKKVNDDNGDWRTKFKLFSNVRIQGNKFYSDQYSGEFVIYNDGKQKKYGLKIYEPWVQFGKKGDFEVGEKSHEDYLKYFGGKYPNTKFKTLTDSDLKSLDKTQIKIMKNEIFARYNYIFKAGGEMDKYFSQQSWYSPQNYKVNDFLNEIESKNIQILTKYE